MYKAKLAEDAFNSNGCFKPVIKSKIWWKRLLLDLFSFSIPFTAVFIVVFWSIAFQTSTAEKNWVEIFNEYHGFLAVWFIITEIVGLIYLQRWNKKNVSEPNYKAFTKWLKKNHNLALDKAYRRSSINNPAIYDIWINDDTILKTSALFVNHKGQKRKYTVIITKNGLHFGNITFETIEPSETNATSNNNSSTQNFLSEVIDTLYVPDLHKHLDEETRNVIRNTTYKITNVSRLDLDIEDQHIIMRAAEELTKLNYNVKNLALLDAVKENVETIKNVVTQLADEVNNVRLREIEKIKQSLSKQLLDSFVNEGEDVKENNTYHDEWAHHLVNQGF